MSKFFLEEIMKDASRQIEGDGRTSKDEPFQTIEVSNKKKSDSSGVMAQPQMPFEIADVIRKVGDILEKTITLKDKFDKALDNESINKPQEIAIRKCIAILKDIDDKLLNDVPRCLSIFD